MEFLEYFVDHFRSIVDDLIELLPKSPISYLSQNTEIAKILSYVNFFIPIYSWIAILETWLIAIVSYYIFQVILRWLKVVE